MGLAFGVAGDGSESGAIDAEGYYRKPHRAGDIGTKARPQIFAPAVKDMVDGRADGFRWTNQRIPPLQRRRRVITDGLHGRC